VHGGNRHLHYRLGHHLDYPTACKSSAANLCHGGVDSLTHCRHVVAIPITQQLRSTEEDKMKNWKTTLAGVIGAIVALGAMAGTYAEFLPPKYAAIAIGVGTLSTAIGNIMSKQYDVHSTRQEITTASIEESAKEIEAVK
jgi:hypothetical protein